MIPNYTRATNRSLLSLAQISTQPFLEDIQAEALLKNACELGFLQVLLAMGIEGHPMTELPWSLGVSGKFDRLWKELLSEIVASGLVDVSSGQFVINPTTRQRLADFDLKMATDELNALNPSYVPYSRQLVLCLASYPELLAGTIPATDVIFPNGDLENVSGIYKNNYRANYFNDILGELVTNTIANAVSGLAPGDKIRILEVGGGTGGTSEGLFKSLRPYADHLEYTFTDISRSFLLYADRYRDIAPYIRTELFNIEASAESQQIQQGYYDIVIGANVVHAVRNIKRTLANLKTTLKEGGLLIMNEIAKTEFFYTVTFGFLEGWWLFEDEELRLKGCPGLSSASWAKAFAQTGYHAPVFLPHDGLPQQIIAAISGGQSNLVAHDAERTPYIVRTTNEPVIKNEPENIQWVRQRLLTIAAETIKLQESEFSLHEKFSDYGFDSILGTTLIKNINDDLGISLKTIDIFNYPDIISMSGYIQGQFAAELARRKPATWPEPVPVETIATPSLPGTQVKECSGRKANNLLPDEEKTIAIIGMAGRFGAAPNLDAFLEAIRDSKSLIEEVPSDRWEADVHYSPLANATDKTASKWGSFLRDIDKFDPMFFNISGREAEMMDPQQRIFLEECWNALEDAGINPQSLKSARCGVFVGAGPSDYVDQTDHHEPSAFWGNASSILASRISYFLDLKGPAVSIDTACSSSLVAIDLARKSLLSDETDLILSGGVWVATRPDFYKQCSKAGMLSPDGQCYTFDSRANGFVPGEGAGVIVMKRLADAKRDGDHIYGLIRGSLTNQDGATNGITAPSSLSQQTLESEAYTQFNINPETIGYVEAHGTGTRLGDPIEFEALTAAFGKFTQKKNFCSLGSVKTNIGHTVMASGVAGVIKILLSFKHRLMLPSINYQLPNPLIDLTNSPFRIQRVAEPWISNGQPRRGAVSSFGFSGTNAHIILEEYENHASRYVSTQPAIIILSARDPSQLTEQVQNLVAFLQANPKADIYDVAYTLQTGREPMEERLALTAYSITELADNLSAYLSANPHGAFAGNMLRRQKALFTAENTTSASVEASIQSWQPSALAELWVKGGAIDWAQLYLTSRPAKISLPTYPFARQRYWLPDASYKNIKAPQSTHPFLQQDISTTAEKRFITTFNGHETVLTDHLVQGEKVFPGAAYLEMARAALMQSGQGEVTSFANISWINPLRVNALPAAVQIRLEGRSTQTSFEVTPLEGQNLLFAKGSVSNSPLKEAAPVDIGALRASFLATKNQQQCYQFFDALGLTYGPSFQGIQTAWFQPDSALSRIQLGLNTDFGIAPAALDCALQTCLCTMMDDGSPNLVVPFRANKILVYQKLPEAFWCHVRKHPQNESNGSNLWVYDLDLFNEQGQILMCFQNMAFLPVANPGISLPQSNSPELSLMSVQWQHSTQTENPALHHAIPPVFVFLNSIAPMAYQLKEVTEAEIETLTESTTQALCWSVINRVQKAILSKTQVHFIFVGNSSDYSNFGLISGILKTANLESPMVTGRVIGVDGSAALSAPVLKAVLDFEQSRSETQVRYLTGKRMVRQLTSSFTAAEPAVSIQEDGVYLITGGAGGLGRSLAQHIVQTPGTHVVLSGRSPMDGKLWSVCQQIGPCEYIQCDVNNADDVMKLVTRVRQMHGRLDGVIHAAGLLQDKLIIKYDSRDEVSSVLSPKVNGARNLDEALQNEPLDFLVFCSSIASVVGNAGQAVYAASNAFLDHYADYRNELFLKGLRKGKTLSINWPFWENGGMQMTMVQGNYLQAAFGLGAMPNLAGLTAFDQVIQKGLGQVAVGYGDPVKINGTFRAKQQVSLMSRHQNVPTTPAPARLTDVAQDVRKKIQQTAAEILKFDAAVIRPDKDLMGYGFDSNMLAQFATELNEFYGINLAPTVFYNYATIHELVTYLTESYSAETAAKHMVVTPPPPKTMEGPALPVASETAPHIHIRADTNEKASNEPVAIIGIAGKFPGSRDLDHFWENIRDMKDLITEVPSERWDWREYFGDPRNDLHKTKAKWGGFIRDMDQFDPLFFEISPVEAELMDPQQRITLEAVYAALEDAAIRPSSLRGSDTGVFIGILNSDYTMLLKEHEDLIIQAQISSGNLRSILTNRISYLLDLHGPSEPIDTACSSSLIAVHRAVENIRSGRCNIAIAGGVNALLSPETTVSISNAGMLSEDGRCKTFDQSANGYVRAEGVGILILKSLSQAERDGDQIYGIIRATSENHGGKASTLTSPNPQAQKELILSAYRSAGVDPRSVTYIEAHGTGTTMGDPIETEGLKLAFATLYKERSLNLAPEPTCGLGSVKTNIGHLESAAGAAGIIKVLLAMRHQTIPGNPQLITPNQYLRLSGSPFYLQKQTGAWPSPAGVPRTAGISGFGFGGANAHIVLEEYLPMRQPKYQSGQPALVVLSAKNKDRLRDRARDMIAFIDKHPETGFDDVVYTLQTGRDAMKERLAFVSTNLTDLKTRLAAFLNGSVAGLFLSTRNTAPNASFDEAKEERTRLDITRALQQKNLEVLATHWVSGEQIEFEQLYQGLRPTKISLPTYPFARKRYWIPARPKKRVTTSPAVLHPLLHHNISTLRIHQYSSTFQGNEPLLADHIINGQAIFPAVLFLEMARQAGTQGLGQAVTTLKSITWPQVLKITDAPTTVHTSLSLTGEGAAFEIHTEENGTQRLHSQGKVSTQLLSAPGFHNLNLLKNKFTESWNKAQYYQHLGEAGLIYGSSFQGIQTLYFAKGEALSLIKLKADSMVLTPGLLDSALQTCLGTMISLDGQIRLAVPFHINELTIHQQLPEMFWSYARTASASLGEHAEPVFDIDLMNDSGTIVAQIKGLSVLPFGLKEKQKPMAIDDKVPAVTRLYGYEWQASPMPPVSNSQTSIETHVMLFGETVPVIARLISEATGSYVHNVQSGASADLWQQIADYLKMVTDKGKLVRFLAIYANSDYHRFGFLSGLLKTARIEFDNLRVTMMGVEADSLHSSEDMIGIVSSEMHDGVYKDEIDVRYIGRARQSRQLVSLDGHSEMDIPIAIRKGGIYLITGGAGGLGRIFAAHLTEAFNARVIIAGRGAIPGELVQFLNKHSNIEYYQVDISDLTAVDELLAAVRQKHGTINGIIHSAGVSRDSLLVNKTEQEVAAVFAPKIDGAVYLDAASRNDDLDFMVFFSSLAAVTGNVGQSDYAAGNAYLDNYAKYRNTMVEQGLRKGRTISINWPLWEEGGMKVDLDTAYYLERRWGIVPMPNEAGIRVFHQSLEKGVTQVVAVYSSDERIANTGRMQRVGGTNGASQQTPGHSELKGILEKELLSMIAALLTYDFYDLMPEVELSSYGFDSIHLTKFTNIFNDFYDADLSPAAFYNHPTVSDLAGYLLGAHPQLILEKHGKLDNTIVLHSQDQPAKTSQSETIAHALGKQPDTLGDIVQKNMGRPVAVVGLSCRFPGAANADEFWELLSANGDAITEVPKDRWNWEQYDGDPRQDPTKTRAKWGGFIKEMDRFDPAFFGISAREAELMDPQHRITLEAVYAALEDAAIATSDLKGSSTGVFIGVISSEYGMMLNRQQGDAVHAHVATGNAHSMLANRISYLLDINGPSVPIDTACSSSLAAVHRAVECIQSGRCTMAIAGGVNAILAPETTLSLSNAGMLSEDGKCKTFDQSANGYVRAEGVGILILKPLDKAVADGDPIYGVIRGSSENHGGRANTLTSPNPLAQKELLIQAYRSGGIDPRAVSYIEAHGTGTSLGDPIETEGLKMAFSELYEQYGLSAPQQPMCALGSVKTNIGHLEAAAGVAGLIKVLLSLKHKTLPGNPQLKVANGHLRLSGSPFFLQTQTTPWHTPAGTLRTAGVSSFGFGGANAHVVTEEYTNPTRSSPTPISPAVIVLSAKNKERLRERVERLNKFLHKNPLISIHDVAYTLQNGRDAMDERLGIITWDTAGLIVQLDRYLDGSGGAHEGNVHAEKEKLKLVKGLPGQATPDQLLAAGDYTRTVELWCLGWTVNWKILYDTHKPARISLPTYPFAREHYWAIAELDKPHDSRPHFSQGPAYPHLLGMTQIARVDWLKGHLTDIASQTIKRAKSEIDSERNFFDDGFDSISGAELIRNINASLPVTLEFADLFNNPNIPTLVAYINKLLPDESNIRQLVSVRSSTAF